MNQPTRYKFCLYVADGAENAARAISNLNAICKAYLPAGHTIKIVDVLKDPQLALAEGIFMTPTLIRLAPGPAVRIVGTLSDTQTVLVALGLEAHQDVA
jgi:circadian clock protein KaiB